MSIQSQTEMFKVTLKLMDDRIERSRQEVFQKYLNEFPLEGTEIEETTPSGVPVYRSRLDWALGWLQRAGYLDRVRRGVYKITEDGINVLNSESYKGDFAKLLRERIAEIEPWNFGADSKDSTKKDVVDAEKDVSPQEQMEQLFVSIQDNLKEELISSILEKDAKFFEDLVVELMEKMGYGKGKTTCLTGDGGIDGVLSGDALGFNPVYIQAKRYAKDNKVGRPAVQGFVGSIGDKDRGVFITTSSFSEEAVKEVETKHKGRIVLIDGSKLADLMIEYNLGVFDDKSFVIKRIDNDYFEE